MNTATNRFRGRAGRRLAAAIVAAAALSLGATACGPDDSGPTGSAETSARPTSGSSSDSSSSPGQNGGESASPGGGSADAGNQIVIVGTMSYLAPGKLIVKPEDGGTDQQFLVANATQILGAAAICSNDDGSVSIGDDGYGTKKCTVDQLEEAAKTNSVTVRVTMDRKSGGADTVEEKYHP